MTDSIAKTIFQKLFDYYGPQNWWPADSPFEVIIGAILTQNTNWTNVEKAILNLKQADALSVQKLEQMDAPGLAKLIRPSGYFNIKAKRLKNVIHFLLTKYDGDLNRMFEREMGALRSELLSLNGVGPETADSILLYAGNYPTFVIDAYTKRIFTRLGLFDETMRYEQMRDYFHRRLQQDVTVFNEYHALIVSHAKAFCNKKPACQGCPLSDIPCDYAAMFVTKK